MIYRQSQLLIARNELFSRVSELWLTILHASTNLLRKMFKSNTTITTTVVSTGFSDDWYLAQILLVKYTSGLEDSAKKSLQG